MNTDFALEIIADERFGILACRGEVDMRTAGFLSEQAYRLIESGCVRLIFDVTGVTYMDSSGLKVLIEAYQLLQPREGSVDLVGCSRSLRRLFDITGLAPYFIHWDTMADARRTMAVPCRQLEKK